MEAAVAVSLAEEPPLAPVECCTPLAEPNITAEQAGTLSAVFKALADSSRVQIVNLLANAPDPVCVCDFMPQLGLSQGTVSFHLKKLLDVGLLEREQRGTWAYYSLNREGLDRLGDVFTTKERAR
jgi:ArsR family transcriptional regulator, arsenate/arsenite/antimonite-responsive transcriptional repressor